MGREHLDEVFEAIRVERDYQDALWGADRVHSVSEWILYMRDYIDQAAAIVSRTSAPTCNREALHIIRKVATMGVACMEQNGIPVRNMRDLKKARIRVRGIEKK
jgi:hypothetical protein